MLGISLEDQERFPEAQEKLEEALSIARASFGPTNVFTLTTLGNVGEVELRRGNLETADQTLRDALAGLEKTVGKEADGLRGPLNILGELRRVQNRLDEATALHRRALAIQLKTVGAENPGVAGTRFQLALDLLARPTPENLAEARSQLDQAIALLRKWMPNIRGWIKCSSRAAAWRAARETGTARAATPRKPWNVSEGTGARMIQKRSRRARRCNRLSVLRAQFSVLSSPLAAVNQDGGSACFCIRGGLSPSSGGRGAAEGRLCSFPPIPTSPDSLIDHPKPDLPITRFRPIESSSIPISLSSIVRLIARS